ncbi:hypothetical protein D9M69_425140 [compost metagenome]
MDFREPDPSIRFANSIPTGQSQLQATAKSQFADRGNNRLVDLGHAHQCAAKVFSATGAARTHLFDVSTGAEQPVLTVEDDSLHVIVGGSPHAGVRNGNAHRSVECIGWRAGQTNESQAIFEAIADQVAHGILHLQYRFQRRHANKVGCMFSR